MDWITTSGASIDEAKSNALDQLGIVADEAEFDIVNDVEKGLFGRIKTEAKVRTRVRPKPPAVKDERRRRNGGKNRDAGSRGRARGRRGSGDKKPGGDKRQSQERSRPNAGKQPKTERGADRSTRSEQGRDRSERNQVAKKKSRPDDSGRSREPTPDRQDSPSSGSAPADDARAPSTGKKKDAVEHEFSRTEQEAAAVAFLTGLTDVLGVDAAVAVADEEAEDGAIEVAVTGSELGLLVGPKGVTLNALQELTRTVVQREARGARTERLRVDVAGYRVRRRLALQDFARGVAEDVLESGSEKILEPMGPADRKVVHDTINEIEGVETDSEGEEPRRRVIIRPSG